MKKILMLVSAMLLVGHVETLRAQCVDSSLITNGPCPLIWAPVCGCNGVTYGNNCEAETWGGVTEYTLGECPPPVTCVDSALIDLTALCPLIWDPVCGCDGVTYSNDCAAINYGGVTEYTPGECGSVGNCAVLLEDTLLPNYDLRLNAQVLAGQAPFVFDWTITGAMGGSIVPIYTSAAGDTVLISSMDLFNSLSCVIVNLCMTDANGCTTCMADTSFGSGDMNCFAAFGWEETSPGTFTVTPTMTPPMFLFQWANFAWGNDGQSVIVNPGMPFSIDFEPTAYDPNGYDFQACMTMGLASGMCIDCQTMHASPEAFTSGTHDASVLPVAVQPNPVGDVMGILTGERTDGSYQLMDAVGRLVLEGRLQGLQTSVQLHGLPAGMYLLKVSDVSGRSNSLRVLKR